MTGPRTAVIGDIHGHLDDLFDLLGREGFVDAAGRWAAGNARLYFLGDYTDRGPDGVGVIELIMRLQAEAAQAGGQVTALLGNHDLIVLNAYRFPEVIVPGLVAYGEERTFMEHWQEHAGGVEQDAQRLQPQHLNWLARLPALVVVGDTLLMHADSLFYLEYGSTVQEVNREFQRLIRRGRPDEVDRLEERFARRREFLPLYVGEDVAAGNLACLLGVFGAARVVHGHTPVFRLLERPAEDMTAAWAYQGGQAVNVDHCLYAGGPGFVFELN